VSKADDIRQRVDALVAAGTPRTEAFKQLAAELSIKYDSVRGAYYTAAKHAGGTPSRTRRRETSADDALADARAALERAIAAIDREVAAAAARASEAKAEHDALKASAAQRKAAITERLEALR
jgi:hypothetical protein